MPKAMKCLSSRDIDQHGTAFVMRTVKIISLILSCNAPIYSNIVTLSACKHIHLKMSSAAYISNINIAQCKYRGTRNRPNRTAHLGEVSFGLHCFFFLSSLLPLHFNPRRGRQTGIPANQALFKGVS